MDREQERVARFAAYLSEGFGCDQVIRIDTDHVGQTSDPGAAEDPAVLARALLVCHAPSALASVDLVARLRCAPIALVLAAPDSSCRVPAELGARLAGSGLEPSFTGWTSADREHRRPLAILERQPRPSRSMPPSTFRVVALMPTYNEADIIGGSLRYLRDQGIGVYVVDNWSTDGTFEKVQARIGDGVLGVERFPPAGPSPTYEWRHILERMEALTRTIEADWFVLHDADERRHSPWPGVDLRAGLHYVDGLGFNCVDHVVVHHWPAAERFDPSADLAIQLPHGTFSRHEGHFHQRRAWKATAATIDFASSAGHDPRFPGRLVYPFKFLLHHYPVRSQEHGERKVLAERAPRWNPEERARGWHQQYDGVAPGHRFVPAPDSIDPLEPETFHEDYLIERLSGIGVFDEPPPWATPLREPAARTA